MKSRNTWGLFFPAVLYFSCMRLHLRLDGTGLKTALSGGVLVGVCYFKKLMSHCLCSFHLKSLILYVQVIMTILCVMKYNSFYSMLAVKSEDYESPFVKVIAMRSRTVLCSSRTEDPLHTGSDGDEIGDGYGEW